MQLARAPGSEQAAPSSRPSASSSPPLPSPQPPATVFFPLVEVERKFKILGFHGPNKKAVLCRREGRESPWLGKMRGRRGRGGWPKGDLWASAGGGPWAGGAGAWGLAAAPWRVLNEHMVNTGKAASSPTRSPRAHGAEDRGAEAGGKGE